MKKSYDTVLWDLDGTIIDSAPGILASLRNALLHLGVPGAQEMDLTPFIGPPLLESFQEYLGFSEAQAQQAVVEYRKYYVEYGMFQCTVYEGLPQLLAQWKAQGKRICLATSKPEVYARRILVHFGLDGFFDVIGGANLNETRSKKSEVIEYVLSLCEGADRSRTVMIGDRKYDVLGAKEAGLDCIGVLYGYGDAQELTQAGATAIAKTMADLRDWLL